MVGGHFNFKMDFEDTSKNRGFSGFGAYAVLGLSRQLLDVLLLILQESQQHCMAARSMPRLEIEGCSTLERPPD